MARGHEEFHTNEVPMESWLAKVSEAFARHRSTDILRRSDSRALGWTPVYASTRKATISTS